MPTPSLPSRLVALIFKPAARYPADPRAVFILALSVFSGFTALLLDSAPETLEALVPRWGVIVWGSMLALGSLVTLIGMASQSLNGIIAEQVGSVVVGATTVFYATLALIVIGPAAGQPLSIILAWGLSCFIRWAQLQSLINQAYRNKVREVVSEQIMKDIEERS